MCDTKHCHKCGQTKPTTEFYKARTNKDGLRGQCKECTKASSKAWREANRDKVRASDRAYGAANRERKAAAIKAWRLANPEHEQAFVAKRRAIKAGVSGPHFTGEQWAEKLQQHNRTCHYCGAEECELKGRLEVDHVIPLSNPNSSNGIDNVVPACKSCNSRKRDRPVGVFLAELKSCQDHCPTQPTQEVN